MSVAHWDATVALNPPRTWLLEASAGTGKTYQIAGLVTRLVAEYGVKIDRLLAITFTKAATGELRDRVRNRLRDALAVFREARPPDGDPVCQHLVAGLNPTDPVWLERQRRLDLALRSFDAASISTIHAFAQRTLTEFAFDSGQDTDLEVLADVRGVLAQVVDDALASLYATATAAEIEPFVTAGFKKPNLLRVAKEMTSVTAPVVMPPAPVRADIADQLGFARSFLHDMDAARAWFSAHEPELRSILNDASSFRGRGRYHEGRIQKLHAWLRRGTPLKELGETWAESLDPAALEAIWQPQAVDIRSRPWWPAIERFAAVKRRLRAFWDGFAPVSVFASTVRGEVDAVLLRRRALSYDGMVSRLAERVTAGGGAGSAIAARMRARYDAVFVDEFQDTDEAQWGVVQAAFHGHAHLFLIGDPKQAIYGFRGADIHVYLRAKQVVDPQQQFTMAQNWRSDPSIVHAMNAVWRPDSGAFDVPRIDFEEIAPKLENRLEHPHPGFVVRWVDARVVDGEAGRPISRKNDAEMARLAAAEIVAWLSGARGRLRLGDEEHRPFEPGDFAILVDDHVQAAHARRALAEVRVPAVAASKASVFATPVADWLVAWLRGLAGAGRDRAARNAVVTPLFGWTADQLAWALDVANRGEDARRDALAKQVRLEQDAWAPDWAAWTDRLRAAAERWPMLGFARTFDREAFECGVYPRVLALPEGERHATDLRHLFQLLHVQERTVRASPDELASWLIAQASASSEELTQQLESDARAVRVETIHKSKGLEYPVVLLPFATAGTKEPGGDAFLLRGVMTAHRAPETWLCLYPEGTPEHDAAKAHAVAEQHREALRKTYVALTRARHHTVAWFGPVGQAGSRGAKTSLGRILYRNPRASGYNDDGMPTFTPTGPDDAWALAQARLNDIQDRSNGSFAWEPVAEFVDTPTAWAPETEDRPALELSVWPEERVSLAGFWRVTSYTGLSRGSGVPDPDEPVRRTAAAHTEAAPASEATGAGPEAVTLPEPTLGVFAELPRLTRGGGTAYGTWVHEVFERIDFRTGQPRRPTTGEDPLRQLVRERARRAGRGSDAEAIDEFVERLPALLSTPLGSAVRGPLAPDIALRDIARADRLDELSFDLCLAEGTRYRPRPSPARGPLEPRPGCVDPGRVYRAVLDMTSPLPGLSAWLAHQAARRDRGVTLVHSMAGLLTGSIDLMFRVAEPDRGHKYFIADYKTNVIRPSAAGHYATPWLDRKMAETGYYLQSLLYTVALHRHLSLRLPDYRYDEHVGGSYYLFLRGMSGSGTPRDPESGFALGVFFDRWPREVVESLDAALATAAGGDA